MKAKTVRIIVAGTGTFPLDMLRYDRCWPVGPVDVMNIASDNLDDDPRHVELEGFQCTDERWKSFGWEVQR